VLVDSERLAVKIDVEVLARLGWAITEAAVIERFVGLSDATIRREIEAHNGRRLANDWEQEFQQIYRAAFAAELTAVDGIADALDRITSQTCVASSGTHDKMLHARPERAPAALRRPHVQRDGGGARQARPDLYLHAAERMGVAPAACADLEDSRFGVPPLLGEQP
jgi:beta-phosphoglucomutase-like phosphatase (HAD superfamily)